MKAEKINRVMAFVNNALSPDEMAILRELTDSTWDAYKMILDAHPEELTSKDLRKVMPESTAHRALNNLQKYHLIEPNGKILTKGHRAVKWKLRV